ncbi:MAG: hypothetical protein QM786_16670 [Breznakibacter sp.]
MKKSLIAQRTLNLVLGLLLTVPVWAQTEKTPAFPGAEGFGRYTTGGRGGAVYHVTSLADDGSEGTLRWAINKGGARTIVFDVSGTIHLTSALSITNGNVTIAGQTAPGDGICVADYPFSIAASNVIIRFTRFRLGNKYVDQHEGDGLGGMDQQNIMIDHCSVSWSIDECLSVYGMKSSTVQWCIASQSLRNSGHTKGAHGYGGNWGGSGASYHHNLMCHHDSRTPRLGPRSSTQTDERMDMRNNVIYNWAGNGCYGGEAMNVNMVNNYYKPGPGTRQKSSSLQYRIAKIGIRTDDYIATYPAFAPTLHTWGTFYVDGNYINGHSDVTADNWTKGIYAQISNDASVDYLYTDEAKAAMRLSAPINFVYTTTHTAETAYEKVLDYAGASLSRDWVDALMVSDTRNGVASYTGSGSGNVYGIIDSQDDNKPADAGSDWSAWPTLSSTGTPTDTDRDGIPDAWETANGLDPNNPNDGSNLNSDGYTMLEVYMNGLVAHIMEAGNNGGTPMGNTVPQEEEGSSTTVTLSKSTYSGDAGATSPWPFTGGYTITNSGGKTYSTGSEDGIKFSSGTRFTVTLPATVKIGKIVFTGYDNYAEEDSYIQEFNGTTLASTDYVFPKKDGSSYTVQTHTITPESPLTNSFTFTFGGKQVVALLELTTSSVTTGIRQPTTTVSDPNARTDVYGIDGRLIRHRVVRGQATEGLPRGIYIVDGKKVMVVR